MLFRNFRKKNNGAAEGNRGSKQCSVSSAELHPVRTRMGDDALPSWRPNEPALRRGRASSGESSASRAHAPVARASSSAAAARAIQRIRYRKLRES